MIKTIFDNMPQIPCRFDKNNSPDLSKFALKLISTEKTTYGGEYHKYSNGYYNIVLNTDDFHPCEDVIMISNKCSEELYSFKMLRAYRTLPAGQKFWQTIEIPKQIINETNLFHDDTIPRFILIKTIIDLQDIVFRDFNARIVSDEAYNALKKKFYDYINNSEK